MFAALDDTGYRLVLLIHIVSVVLAFGPNFVGPMLRRGGASNESLAKTTKTIQLPSLVVTFVAGILLVVLSDDQWKFSQTWVSIAFLVTIAAGVLLYLLAGAYEKNEEPRVAMFSGILHLLLVVGIFTMLWKPGL